MAKVTTPAKSIAKTNISRLQKLRFPKFAGFRKNTPPIVEVRKGELKKTLTAEEKIIALNRSKNAAKLRLSAPDAQVFMPQDFDPSTLPVGGQIPTTGILPSLNPNGGGTSIDSIDPDAALPADVMNLPEILEGPPVPVRSAVDGPVPPMPEETTGSEDQ